MNRLQLFAIASVLCPISSVFAQSPPSGGDPVHGIAPAQDVIDLELPGDGSIEPPEDEFTGFDGAPVPMPTRGGTHRGALRLVGYDFATGVEQEFPITSLPPQIQEWLDGREVAEFAPEPEPESFGSLASITSKAYPWSTKCRVTFNQNGVTYVGSGTLLDPQTVITAGHCVHGGSGGGWSTSVTVAPAFDGDANAFGSSTVEQQFSFNGWTASSDLNFDMGFIRLKRPVGYLTGWLGSFYNTSGSFWASTTFRAAGYPGGTCFTGAPNRLYSASGLWNGIATNRVEAALASACWVGGMSGGGVFYTDAAGSRYCGAVMSYAYGYPQTTRIGCNRMTQTKFDALVGTVIPSGYPTTAKDLVPLRARTGSTTIQRGDAPSSMEYRVYNNSSYNPASATTSVKVYLSTNSTISTSDTLIQSHTFSWNFGAKSGVTITMTPPTIPASTAPGTYYLGVWISSSDADNSNNATSGWDAQRITVTL